MTKDLDKQIEDAATEYCKRQHGMTLINVVEEFKAGARFGISLAQDEIAELKKIAKNYSDLIDQFGEQQIVDQKAAEKLKTDLHFMTVAKDAAKSWGDLALDREKQLRAENAELIKSLKELLVELFKYEGAPFRGVTPAADRASNLLAEKLESK